MLSQMKAAHSQDDIRHIFNMFSVLFMEYYNNASLRYLFSFITSNARDKILVSVFAVTQQTSSLFKYTGGRRARFTRTRCTRIVLKIVIKITTWNSSRHLSFNDDRVFSVIHFQDIFVNFATFFQDDLCFTTETLDDQMKF